MLVYPSLFHPPFNNYLSAVRVKSVTFYRPFRRSEPLIYRDCRDGYSIRGGYLDPENPPHGMDPAVLCFNRANVGKTITTPLSLSLSLLESKQVAGYLRLLPLASLARFITDALPDANSTGPQSHATI